VSWLPDSWSAFRGGAYAFLFVAAVLVLLRLWGPSGTIFADLASTGPSQPCAVDTTYYGVARYMTRYTTVYCHQKGIGELRFFANTRTEIRYRSLAATIGGTALLVAICWVAILGVRRVPPNNRWRVP
jgi:hypothetical protein